MNKGRAYPEKNMIEYAADSIVSKTVIEKKTGTVTFFAFDKGQGLSEHSAPFDALVHVIDGSAEIVIGGEKHIVQEGSLIIMPADVPHSLYAGKRFKMILTMIRSSPA